MIKNVLEYLIKSEINFPEKIAFISEEKQINFRELNEEAKKLGKKIENITHGKINQPIAVYMKKSIDCMIAFMGILYSGNYYSPIDTNSPEERIHIILKSLQPKIIISNLAEKEQLKYYEIETDFIFIEEMEDMLPEESMLKGYTKVLDIDPVYVLFTSGSTGVPKGVVVGHKSVIDYTEWLNETFAFNENTVFGNQAPFYFDNSILDIYSTLKNAASMVMIPERLFMFSNKLFSFLNEYRVNTIFWVPSALNAVANSGILKKMKINCLEKVLFCGEVMPTKTYNLWKNEYVEILFANLYGPTEITDVCSYYMIDREFENDESLPIGKSCENTQIIILNNLDKEAKVDEIGELCVRGSCLALGYYGQNEKAEKVFVQNPLNDKYRDLIYRTGDLVKCNDYGEIIYLGRSDSQIKFQGHRIELGEIESVCYTIQNIKQCCTLFDGERIVLYCAIEKNLRDKDIFQFMKSKLPKYMVPKLIKILDKLPLNQNGKIDRVQLEKIYKGDLN